MRITKILNSSVVLVENYQGEELILLAKGIGYNHKIGDNVENVDVEKIFVPQSKMSVLEYANELAQIDEKVIDIANQIVSLAKKELSIEFSAYLTVALIDHIEFSLERFRNGVKVQNKLVFEVERMYPKEFIIGQKALEIINLEFNTEFTIEEAGNIAFHIVNATKKEEDLSVTYKIVEFVKDILNIIRYSFKEDIQINHFNYSRLLVHLEFFAKRVINKEPMEDSNFEIADSIIKKFPTEYACACKIKDYVYANYGMKLHEEELVYLTIHIKKVQLKYQPK